MVDVETIRAAYSKMPDEALLNFAQTEGNSLSQKAFIVLKQEMRKRKISTSIISEIESKRVDVVIEKVRNNQQKYDWENYRSLFQFILNKKYESVPDAQLRNKLVEKGYSEDDAKTLVESAEKIIHELIKKEQATRITGVLVLAAGAVAIVIFSNNEQENLITSFSLTILSSLIFLIGLIKIFSASIALNKYRTIVKNLVKLCQATGRNE